MPRTLFLNSNNVETHSTNSSLHSTDQRRHNHMPPRNSDIPWSGFNDTVCSMEQSFYDLTEAVTKVMCGTQKQETTMVEITKHGIPMTRMEPRPSNHRISKMSQSPRPVVCFRPVVSSQSQEIVWDITAETAQVFQRLRSNSEPQLTVPKIEDDHYSSFQEKFRQQTNQRKSSVDLCSSFVSERKSGAKWEDNAQKLKDIRDTLNKEMAQRDGPRVRRRQSMSQVDDFAIRKKGFISDSHKELLQQRSSRQTADYLHDQHMASDPEIVKVVKTGQKQKVYMGVGDNRRVPTFTVN